MIILNDNLHLTFCKHLWKSLQSALMFIDRAKILVTAGDGGNGATAFRREKFVVRGGPSGGDGGNGGNVWMEADENFNTLLHLRYNPEHKAARGNHGKGSNRYGKDGKDITIKVPVGTEIFDVETKKTLFDFTENGQRFLAAEGGRGGFGNTHFKTSTNQAPTYHQEGAKGEYRELHLELRLIADVGLVGFPNSGKSTLISVISAAKPKIAAYPFTTIEPNLGVVNVSDYKTFVVADIPGLIEGASEGAGLGDRFLRHIERTKLLLHMVDVSSISGREPAKDYEAINRELKIYNENLTKRPQIVVATKLDALDETEKLETLRKKVKKDRKEFFEISAIAKKGTRKLIFAISKKLDEISEIDSEADKNNDFEWVN